MDAVDGGLGGMVEAADFDIVGGVITIDLVDTLSQSLSMGSSEGLDMFEERI